ncbi:hypothetical protein [Streptomyces sp. NPDC088400]|uniref:hypothetical protein n=1 Tax=Streptomyces sp. NPDC088400 TaxID=3365861 RepID=UPI003819630D
MFRLLFRLLLDSLYGLLLSGPLFGSLSDSVFRCRSAAVPSRSRCRSVCSPLRLFVRSTPGGA